MRLPIDVYSSDQISALTMELRAFIDARTDASRRSQHTGDADPEGSVLLQSLLTQNDSKDPKQLLSELQDLLQHAPTVHVITAALPSHDLKQQLTRWFRSEIHEHSLLAFAERRDIGGGIIVRAGSQIYDFSFKRKVLESKHRITELAFDTAQPSAQPTQTEATDVR